MSMTRSGKLSTIWIALIWMLLVGIHSAAEDMPKIPSQGELMQLDSVLDANPNLGQLFRSNPRRIIEPSVIAKFPALQAVFKQNPDLMPAIGRYFNAFQQREFRFAYGQAGTVSVPRAAVDWFDDYMNSTPSVATTLRKTPTAIDSVSDQVLQTFLKTYPEFSDIFKKHPGVFLYCPDFFKHYQNTQKKS